MKPLPRVDTTSVKEQFKNHFESPNNNRIVFSGPFGVGKTTFLKDYLKENEFNNFWITPVRYSVGSNEDIFEFIKFDIITDICLKFLEPSQKEKFPESLFIWSYLNSNLAHILHTFFDIISELEATETNTKQGIKAFKSIYENYKSYKGELESKIKKETEIFTEYIDLNIRKVGSIFEDDLITKSIRSYLEYLKGKGKRNILIIDDFDRIDPEHIFRIFNILSVHNDYLKNTYDNKFGFDKIIIVCDIDSIKSYFYHKYGANSNFEGYMDKFCSTQYFRFSTELALSNFCQENMSINGIPKSVENTFIFLILQLIKQGEITLRKVLKYRYRTKRNKFTLIESLSFSTDSLCQRCSYIEAKALYVDSTNFPFIHCLGILSDIFGDFDQLNASFKRLSKSAKLSLIPKDAVKDIVETIAPLAHLAKNSTNINPLCYQRDDRNGRSNRHGGFNHGGSTGLHIKNPTISFMNQPVILNFGWTTYNKYTSQNCYFENLEVTASNLNKFKETERLFFEIDIIIEFLRKNGFEYKI